MSKEETKMSKDYLDKWEERQKQNTEIIEQQQTKTKKMGNKPIDTAELERCKNDMYYFYKKYILINGEEPLMTRGQFQDMISTWNKPIKTIKVRNPYSSWDGSLDDCGDANEY